jgi:hypothetical protein
MAATEVFRPDSGTLTLPVADATAAGTPVVVFGLIPAVTLTAEGEGGNAALHATCAINPAWVHDLPVKGEDGAGAAAIAIGDPLYVDTDGELNADATNGTQHSIALEAVASGATSTIRVFLLPASVPA